MVAAKSSGKAWTDDSFSCIHVQPTVGQVHIGHITVHKNQFQFSDRNSLIQDQFQVKSSKIEAFAVTFSLKSGWHQHGASDNAGGK